MEATEVGVNLNREELCLTIKIFNYIYEKEAEELRLSSQEKECFMRMLGDLNEE